MTRAVTIAATTSTVPAIMTRALEGCCLEGLGLEGWVAAMLPAGFGAWPPARKSLTLLRAGRRAGSTCRHSWAKAKKGGGMDAGTTGSPPADLSQNGGRWVRASTSTTPSDHTSEAGDICPSSVSGAPYSPDEGE